MIFLVLIIIESYSNPFSSKTNLSIFLVCDDLLCVPRMEKIVIFCALADVTKNAFLLKYIVKRI